MFEERKIQHGDEEEEGHLPGGFIKDLDEEAAYELKKGVEAMFLPGLYDCVLFRISVSQSDYFPYLELTTENKPTRVVANPSISLLPRASSRILL